MPSRLDGDMIDLDALRRWFTDELWGAAEPAWFTNMGPELADDRQSSASTAKFWRSCGYRDVSQAEEDRRAALHVS